MEVLADGPQVQVKFVTQQRQYAIPETPIQTPARLGRYGLSQIINLILQNEGGKSTTSPAVAFCSTCYRDHGTIHTDLNLFLYQSSDLQKGNGLSTF